MTDVPAALSESARTVAQEFASAPWYAALLPHWSTVLGAALALYVCGRQLAERRPPGNILAWGMLILISPLFGLFCFILIGERKRREMVRLRKAVARVPLVPVKAEAGPPPAFLPLTDPDAAAHYAEILRRIASARRHILVTTYIFGDDPTGRDLIARLAARASEGVKVFLLVDAIGSRGASDACFAPLVRAGGRFARFMPAAIWRRGAHLRNHRKLMIFDGESAIVGGRNLSEEYLGPVPFPGRYRDFALVIENAGIAELTRVFAGDWCFATGDSPSAFLARIAPAASAQDAGVEVVTGGPDHHGDPIWEKLIVLLAQARREIVIVTPYLVPDEALLSLLRAKARSGVRVRVITPRRSDHRIADFARRRHARALREAGAHVLYYGDAFLHGKLVLTDNETAVIGSANFDMRSLFINFELAIVIRHPETVAGFAVAAEELASRSHLSPGRRKRASRLLETIAESVAHLLAPLL